MNDCAEFLPDHLRLPGLQFPAAVADALRGTEGLGRIDVPPQEQLLLRRLDSKYMMPRERLAGLLRGLADRFVVLTAAGQPVARYVTVYFDTDQHTLLNDHLRGRRPRHKLRMRHYLDRELTTLEIKSRLPSGRTDKAQRAHLFGSNQLEGNALHWAGMTMGIRAPLRAQAWSSCQRITLLHCRQPCRLTIDLNVALGSVAGARSLHQRVLIEFKRERSHAEPALSQALQAAGARRSSVSKYVAAMLNGVAEARRARFAAVLGRLSRAECWQECRA
jgi:hypothetical protein